MTTFRITFEQNDPMGMPAILQREIWESCLETLTRYLPDAKAFFAYLREQTATRFTDKSFRVEDTQMIFDFEGDFAAYARHALALMVSARQGTLQKLAGHHDIELVDVPDLRDALKSVERTFADGDVGAPDGGAPDGGAPDGGAPDGGAPDGGAPDIGASGAEARCKCPLCRQFRPDQVEESRWIAALESDDQAGAEHASFFVLQAAEPGIDALRALARASIDLGEYRLRRALFNKGKRLPGDRFSAIQEAIQTSRDEHEAAGLLALLAGLQVDPTMRFDALQKHFETGSPAAETAIEFLGYGDVPGDQLTQLAESLEDLVDRNDEVDYAIALTLYNLFREVDYPPSVVKTTLRKLTGARGEAADVASRALAWFESS